MPKKIENPWCVYTFLKQAGIGIVYEEGGGCLIVQGSEKDGHYMPWDLNGVKRFSTAGEAIQYYQETKPKPYPLEKNLTNEEVLEKLKIRFPSHFNGKS